MYVYLLPYRGKGGFHWPFIYIFNSFAYFIFCIVLLYVLFDQIIKHMNEYIYLLPPFNWILT